MRNGVKAINFDLMYGLPHQTAASLADNRQALGGAEARSHRAVRLCACALDGQEPAHDPRGRAAHAG